MKYNPIGNQLPETPHYQDYDTSHNWEVNNQYVRGKALDSFVRNPSRPSIDQRSQYRTRDYTGLASDPIYFGHQSIPVYRFEFTAIYIYI